jgi:hypothetical protein
MYLLVEAIARTCKKNLNQLLRDKMKEVSMEVERRGGEEAQKAWRDTEEASTGVERKRVDGERSRTRKQNIGWRG